METIEAPFFLVALPQLQDEYFARKVVLMGHHDDKGAFGLILNQPLSDENDNLTQMTAELKDLFGNTVQEFHEDLFGGGPLDEEAIYCLHNIPEFGNEESAMAENLFLATDPDVFQKLLEKDEFKGRRRFFLGCASWEAGQLDVELRNGSWLMVPFNYDFIFEAVPENHLEWSLDLWKRVLQAGGADPLTLMSPVSGGSNNSDPGQLN